MTLASSLLTAALKHHQAGRLPEAEQLYRQILQADPNQPDALHLLGVIARQVGMNDVAVDLIGHAIQLRGNSPDFYNNLGGAYLDLKKFAEAAANFRKSIELKPDYAVAHSNLGNALREMKQFDEAIAACRKAVKLNPESADHHVNLANALKERGMSELAMASYQRALERNPHLAVAHNNLANLFKDQGKLERAISSYLQALQLNPASAEMHNNLGNAYSDLGEWEQAIASFQRALELNPDYPEALNNLSNVFIERNQIDEAIAHSRRALEIKPDYARAHNSLGNALVSRGDSSEAVMHYRRALELDPHDAEVCNNLGGALQSQGHQEEATDCYKRALELKPNFAQAHSNLLLTLQYRSDVTLQSLYEAHVAFDRQHAWNLRREAVVHPKNNRIPLRIGFISADLGRHPVGYFLIGLLENLDRNFVEVYCYSDRPRKDDLTERIRTTATQWYDSIGISDEELANRIQSDQVDALFDLAGHSAHNRMLVFARKPARIQITWAGYASTTGVAAIDYILADQFEIPAESEPFYSERVLRMPHGYLCYEPPHYAPPVNPLPARECGAFTFGCFNNHLKITDHVLNVWNRILQRLPKSRLLLKYTGWNDPDIAGRIIQKLSSEIDPARIEFQGQSPHAELLGQYNRVDLALDPFPYSGGLTTCEALWMGVPVLTCPGETFASRHSLSHLSNVGLTETIAESLDDYVERAVRLATDLPGLARMRSELRDRMATSPLCDQKKFAQDFMTMLQNLPQPKSATV